MAKKYLELGKYLKKLLFERDMRPIDLARETNIPTTTIHRLVTSKSMRPNKSTLESLAKYFSISVEQLIGQDALPDIKSLSKSQLSESNKILVAMQSDLRSIPILEWDIQQIQNLSNDQGQHYVVTGGVSEKSFALIMSDTSMEPSFTKGSILIFDPEKKTKDRSFVLVKLEGIELPIFRELLIDADQRYLKAHSHDFGGFQVRILEKNHRILGTLVESRKNFNEVI